MDSIVRVINRPLLYAGMQTLTNFSSIITVPFYLCFIWRIPIKKLESTICIPKTIAVNAGMVRRIIFSGSKTP